jgi:hypothetical protein
MRGEQPIELRAVRIADRERVTVLVDEAVPESLDQRQPFVDRECEDVRARVVHQKIVRGGGATASRLAAFPEGRGSGIFVGMKSPPPR